MSAKLIAFPRKCCIPSAAIAAWIEGLIAILDERDAASADLEPDMDFEDGGDAETEAWPDWRPARVVSIGPLRKSGEGRPGRKARSSNFVG